MNQVRSINRGAGIQSAGQDSDIECRESEIPARTSAIEYSAADLHGTIDILASRLETILQAAEPSNEGAGAIPTSTQLGGRLTTINYRVRSANDRLHDILRRLEV